MIVTVANLKGGAGKTTTAVFVAHALAEATGAPCALIDADPQGSAAQWAHRAGTSGRPLSVPVLAQPTPRLSASVPGAAHLVIDTPPAQLGIVTAAIALADLVLVPTSASALDLSRIQATVDAAARQGTPSAVLLTRTRRTRSVGAAEESLRAAGIRLLNTHIPLREALAMAFGKPVRQLHGYDLATAELLGVLPEEPYSVEAVRERAARTRPAHRRPMPQRLQLPSIGELRLPQAPVRSEPVELIDEELIARLRSSMARLAARS